MAVNLITRFSSPFVLLTLFSAIISIGVIIYSWNNRKEFTNSKYFIFVVLGIIIWTFSYGIGLTIFNLEIRKLFEIPAWIGRVIIPVSWIIFSLGYSGRDKLITKKTIFFVSIIPCITVIISILSIWNENIYQLMWINYRIVPTYGAATVQYTRGIWMVIQTLYAWILIFSGIIILLGTGIFQSPSKLYNKQSIALILGAFIPTAMSFKWLYNIGPLPQMDFTPISLFITGVAFGYSLIYNDLLIRTPGVHRVGWQEAIDNFQDGVVIIDKNKLIIDMNVSAEKIFECNLNDVLNDSIESLININSLDVENEEKNQFLKYESERGIREFDFNISSITDHRRNIIGYMLTFHDVTQQRLRKQRLEVLNRVLRHNLRNEMNSILLYSELIKQKGEKKEIAKKIEKNAKNLINLGEDVREIENFVATERSIKQEFEINILLESIIHEIEEKYDKVEISIESDEKVKIKTDRIVLKEVLYNIIENAVEHNDSTKPKVNISIEDNKNGWISINISDNGPGIPKEEISVIEEGTETPLKHASSLGLWLIKWGINVIGGELNFEIKEKEGSTVKISIPKLVEE